MAVVVFAGGPADGQHWAIESDEAPDSFVVCYYDDPPTPDAFDFGWPELGPVRTFTYRRIRPLIRLPGRIDVHRVPVFVPAAPVDWIGWGPADEAKIRRAAYALWELGEIRDMDDSARWAFDEWVM